MSLVVGLFFARDFSPLTNPLSLPVVSLQVGNLGLLFMLLFFIFAALGVELFGDLSKDTCTILLYTGSDSHTYIPLKECTEYFILP